MYIYIYSPVRFGRFPSCRLTVLPLWHHACFILGFALSVLQFLPQHRFEHVAFNNINIGNRNSNSNNNTNNIHNANDNNDHYYY